MDGNSPGCMRLSTLVLILALALFYNAGTFLPGPLGGMNHHLMYLFGTVGVGSVLLFPVFANFPLYLAFPFWGVAYLLAAPHFTGGYTVEVMLSGVNLMNAIIVAGVSSLTHWYVKRLDGYLRKEGRLADIASAPPLLDDEADDIKYEITRARRYSRPISVIMLQPVFKPFSPVDKVSLARTLSRIFRRTERLYDLGKNGRFLIFCSETSHSSAEMLVNRIRIMVHREQDIHFVYGIATFPDQELTFEGLVMRAKENLEAGASHKSAAIKSIKSSKLATNR